MITVRFYAGAREAAGAATAEVEAPDVAALRRALRNRFGSRLGDVVDVSTLLCDGQRLADADALAAGALVEVLPPFAGG